MSEINIGILVNTHGLHGEVKVKPTTDFVDIRFAKGQKLHLQQAGTPIELQIQYAKPAKQLLIVKFEGYDDINQVEAWKGSMLTLAQEELHELEEDEAYFFELMDCAVFDEEGHALGQVVEVLETSANAVLRVRSEEREFLVPYVKAFVPSFDREAKRLVLHLVDGLL